VFFFQLASFGHFCVFFFLKKNPTKKQQMHKPYTPQRTLLVLLQNIRSSLQILQLAELLNTVVMKQS